MCKFFQRLTMLLVLAIMALPGETRPEGSKGRTAADANGVQAVLWRLPVDIASLNLLYGSGGEDRQPHGPFTFIEEDSEGTNPKIDVRDQDGVKWKVKFGSEARPEVVATRLVWAAGYFTTDDYFVENLQVKDLPSHLHRGQDLVGPDSTLHNVRLKRPMKGQEKIGTWRWAANPFVGTREFNGLRVLMALMNNWDLKDVNNAIYEDKQTREQTYVVSDLGATFGTTGYIRSLHGSRGNLEAYKRSKFISNLGGDRVDFESPSRPTLIESVNIPVYMRRLDLRWIGRRIPRDDAKWMGQVLAQLSAEQIRDAFRAAGYSAQDVDEFAAVVQDRIARLNAL